MWPCWKVYAPADRFSNRGNGWIPVAYLPSPASLERAPDGQLSPDRIERVRGVVPDGHNPDLRRPTADIAQTARAPLRADSRSDAAPRGLTSRSYASATMPELYLVRHAVAVRRDSEQWPDDSVRPLTPDGIERFRAVARGLRRIGVEVDAVLASPYARGWATAEILHEEIAWPAPEKCAALEPHGPLSTVVDAVRSRTETALALVGHQPRLSELATLLLAGSERAMRLEVEKGGVLCLRFAEPLEAGAVALRWSASPKILRLLAD